MDRRSDKYENNETPQETNSRVKKNRLLYEEINSKIGYEEISNFESNTEIDLSSLNVDNPSRADYQKIKEYKELLGASKEEKIESVEREFKPKTFDINLVLEEAKKNREIDDLEQKRNLKDEEYSVLSNLNKKYLYKKDFNEEDEEELKELIDTVTNLEIQDTLDEKDLLSELLATTVDIKLESELSPEELKALYTHQDSQTEDEIEIKELENTFYTKSMELTKEDLIEAYKEDEEDDDDSFYPKRSKGKTIAIILITILFITMLVIVAYFLIKQI